MKTKLCCDRDSHSHRHFWFPAVPAMDLLNFLHFNLTNLMVPNLVHVFLSGRSLALDSSIFQVVRWRVQGLGTCGSGIGGGEFSSRAGYGGTRDSGDGGSCGPCVRREVRRGGEGPWPTYLQQRPQPSRRSLLAGLVSTPARELLVRAGQALSVFNHRQDGPTEAAEDVVVAHQRPGHICRS